MYKFEDVHGDKEDYEKYLAVQKKVKKEKTIRDKLFSDLKRKKKKKPKSSFQEIIDGLSKKKYKDFYEIKDYLSSEKGINVKRRTLTFLETVMKARVVNGKFTVSDVKSYYGRNPQNVNEVIKVPESKRIHFSAGSKLKKRIKDHTK